MQPGRVGERLRDEVEGVQPDLGRLLDDGPRRLFPLVPLAPGGSHHVLGELVDPLLNLELILVQFEREIRHVCSLLGRPARKPVLCRAPDHLRSGPVTACGHSPRRLLGYYTVTYRPLPGQASPARSLNQALLTSRRFLAAAVRLPPDAPFSGGWPSPTGVSSTVQPSAASSSRRASARAKSLRFLASSRAATNWAAASSTSPDSPRRARPSAASNTAAVCASRIPPVLVARVGRACAPPSPVRRSRPARPGCRGRRPSGPGTRHRTRVDVARLAPLPRRAPEP